MTIKERIEKVVSNKESGKQPDANKLGDFYEQMKREGAVLKKQYDLPPLDTVGRSLYQEPSVKEAA